MITNEDIQRQNTNIAIVLTRELERKRGYYKTAKQLIVTFTITTVAALGAALLYFQDSLYILSLLYGVLVFTSIKVILVEVKDIKRTRGAIADLESLEEAFLKRNEVYNSRIIIEDESLAEK